MTSRWPSRLRAAAFGLAAGAALLLLGEASLRLYRGATLPSAGAAGSGAEIWCAGDSNTEGVGAPEGRGYPEQLEAALARRGLPRTVANLGAAGASSTEAAEDVQRELEAGGRPRLVLAMIGTNDLGNLRSASGDVLRTSRPALRLHAFLQRFLLYQLASAALRRPDPYALFELARWSRFRRAEERLERKSADDRLMLAVDAGRRARYEEARRDFELYLAGERESSPRLKTPLDENVLGEELRRLSLQQRGLPVGREDYDCRSEDGRAAEAELRRFGCAWLAAYRGDLAASRRAFRALAAAAPTAYDRAAALEGLGWVELEAGHAAAARALFQRVRTPRLLHAGLLPHRYWSSLGLALLEARGGRRAQAARLLDEARSMEFHSDERACWDETLGRRLGLPSSRSGCASLGRRPALGLAEGEALDVPAASYLDGRLRRMAVLRDVRLAQEALSRAVERLEALAGSYGFELVLLTYPQHGSFEAGERLRREAAARRIRLIDVADALGEDETPWLSPDGYHLNESGYGRVAEAIAGALAPGLRAAR
jgi:lysophospholipase L1-like esterase